MRKLNDELASRYLKVAAQYCNDYELYKLRQKAEIIRKYGVDLVAYFSAVGSLKKLEIKGLGETSIGDLELLLSKGEEYTRKVLEERNMSKLNRARYKGIRNKVNLEKGNEPSNDNSSKIYEGG
ncbi:MAG: hypothetical protein Q7S27_00920 [Nanoarchaeota archaeon]|nr:hypothetical protein [Nanoarchaeota archaeon]